MVQFAKQELEDGSILNAKSIMDSLNKNLEQTGQFYPIELKKNY